MSCMILSYSLTLYLSLLAKGLTLEEIDLLWADEEFRNTHAGLQILHQTTPSSNESIILESQEKSKLENKESGAMA